MQGLRPATEECLKLWTGGQVKASIAFSSRRQQIGAAEGEGHPTPVNGGLRGKSAIRHCLASNWQNFFELERL